MFVFGKLSRVLCIEISGFYIMAILVLQGSDRKANLNFTTKTIHFNDLNTLMRYHEISSNSKLSPTVMVSALLTLSCQSSLSHRNQSTDLLCKSMDWFLYDTDFPHERVTFYVTETQLRKLNHSQSVLKAAQLNILGQNPSKKEFLMPL